MERASGQVFETILSPYFTIQECDDIGSTKTEDMRVPVEFLDTIQCSSGFDGSAESINGFNDSGI